MLTKEAQSKIKEMVEKNGYMLTIATQSLAGITVQPSDILYFVTFAKHSGEEYREVNACASTAVTVAANKAIESEDGEGFNVW